MRLACNAAATEIVSLLGKLRGFKPPARSSLPATPIGTCIFECSPHWRSSGRNSSRSGGGVGFGGSSISCRRGSGSNITIITTSSVPSTTDMQQLCSMARLHDSAACTTLNNSASILGRRPASSGWSSVWPTDRSVSMVPSCLPLTRPHQPTQGTRSLLGLPRALLPANSAAPARQPVPCGCRSSACSSTTKTTTINSSRLVQLHATAAEQSTVGPGDADGSSSSGRIVITTPLYYVNAAPHMGSAYPTIAADALARFYRLTGRDVVFVTGTDEHGEKIALAAAAAGREPKEHCDKTAEEYKQLWSKLNIAYDRFVRTTDERHEKIVDQFFRRCADNGDIFRAQYEGLYCVACEEYKDEKELVAVGEAGKCCPIHLKPCDERSEDNLFFALSKYQGRLEQLFRDQPEFVRPSFRKNEVLAWVDEGVRDFSISRAAVAWGIPVPGTPEQTIYVWFDALLGYVSSLLEADDGADLDTAVSRGWPAHVHIIGKDILRFHAVYWPAMLMSAGLPTPRAVFGHGFLTKDGIKMGKSLGNTLDPLDLVERYGADAVRYFFLKEIEFGKDGDFSQTRFVNIVNANLANTVGNLVNRTLGLLGKNCGGVIAVDSNQSVAPDHPLRTQCAAAVQEAATRYADLDFAGACTVLLDAAAAGNVYLEERAPWTKFKKGTDEEKAAAAADLVAVLEVARCVAVGLSPVVPQMSAAVFQQLGFNDSYFSSLKWEDASWGGLVKGQATSEPVPVFQRIVEEGAEDGAQKAAGKAAAATGKKQQKKKMKATSPAAA